MEEQDCNAELIIQRQTHGRHAGMYLYSTPPVSRQGAHCWSRRQGKKNRKGELWIVSLKERFYPYLVFSREEN